MKKVLIFTSGEGHWSIAQALKYTLTQAGFQVIVSVSANLNTFKAYTPFYRYFPSLFKVPYKLGEQETIQKGFKLFVGRLLNQQVKKEIKIHQPDLIISCYMFYNPAIAKVLDYQKNHIPFLNLVPNPWNLHPLEFSPQADFNLVYDNYGIKIGRQYKLPKDKIIPCGWFIRPEFNQNQNTDKIRKSLGFKKDVLTLLICGGSEGTNMILKIIPSLFITKKPLQVILICGTNKTLYNTTSNFIKITDQFKRIKNKYFQFYPKFKLKLVRFTDKLAEFISISDLIIGKAGPNLIFETAAMQKPFFAICHISGQEDNNLNLIKKKGLGFVEENTLKAIQLLNKIIDKPNNLQKFQKNIIKLKQENLQANLKLVSLIKNLLHETN